MIVDGDDWCWEGRVEDMDHIGFAFVDVTAVVFPFRWQHRMMRRNP